MSAGRQNTPTKKKSWFAKGVDTVRGLIDDVMTRPEAFLPTEQIVRPDPAVSNAQDQDQEQAYAARYRYLIRPSMQESVVKSIKRVYAFFASLSPTTFMILLLLFVFIACIIAVPAAVCLWIDMSTSSADAHRLASLATVGFLGLLAFAFVGYL